MYCPRCATPNLEGVKFCRACGTNLVTVALALEEQSSPLTKQDPPPDKIQDDWLSKRRYGMKKIVEGTGLISASTLLGAALGVFSHEPHWIIIWFVMVGWMAVIGVMALAYGIGSLLESRFIRRELMRPETQLPVLTTRTNDPFSAPITSPKLSAPSVTDNTTELLNSPDQTR